MKTSIFLKIFIVTWDSVLHCNYRHHFGLDIMEMILIVKTPQILT